MATRASRIALAGSNISSTGEVDADLLDNTDSAAFLSLDGDGRLGIGTASAERALHIEGSGFAASTINLVRTDTGASNDPGLQFKSAAGANDSRGMGGIWFKNSLDGNAYALIRARTDDATGTSGRLDFMTSTSAVSNSTTPSLTIKSTGNVGIGTNAPSAPLQLNTAGNIVDGTFYSTFTINNTGSSTWSRIRFDRSGVAKWGISLGTDDKFKISNLFTGGTAAAADDTCFVIDNNGNIGIGTAAPVASLDLRGKTDAIIVPRGTTAQRPSSPANGMIRYNTTINIVEEYRNGQWAGLSNVFTAAGGTESTYSSGGVDYKVHTFTSSGNFTVQSGNVTVDYLVIAGGGGGGGHMSGGWYNDPAGGGGAGGMITGTMSVTSGSYSITIGAGGVSRSTAAALNGGNTTFSSATAVGGGGGGAGAANNAQTQRFGQSGGSGGGGGGPAGLQATATGGSGTSGQGNAGGFGGSSSPQNQISGGGGGKGAAGENAQWSSRSGTGGVGATNSLRTGSGVYYAGGGGGGGSNQLSIYGQVGGNGGGGRGGDREANSLSSTATAGAANTGGGGGGANASTTAIAFVGRNGGSGIVIIRYPV